MSTKSSQHDWLLPEKVPNVRSGVRESMIWVNGELSPPRLVVVPCPHIREPGKSCELQIR